MDGIVFIARLGSTRLQRKHLIEVSGHSFIEWLVLRFMSHFKKSIESGELKLILATADEPENRKFETTLKSLPVEIFYGSSNNIPLRLFECARQFNLENIISIDGDDILCSAEAAGNVLSQLKNVTGKKWFKTTGLPLGMNVAGYKREVLESAHNEMGTGKLETGWGRVFADYENHSISLGDYESEGDFRFTLDYQEDSEFFGAIIGPFGEKIISATDQQIIEYVINNDLTRFNRSINTQYWANFNKQIKEEN